MTEREKLIEKVVNIIWHDRARHLPKSRNDLAKEIINTIFEELKETSEDMLKEASGYIIAYPEKQYCTNEDAKECWQAMLNASPLAPDKEND